MGDLGQLIKGINDTLIRLTHRVQTLERQEAHDVVTGLVAYLGSFNDSTATAVDDQVATILGVPAVDGMTVLYYSTGDSDVLLMTRSSDDWDGHNLSDGTAVSRT